MANYTEQMQRIFHEWEEEGNPLPVDAATVAKWAVETNRWHMKPEAVIKKCAEDLSSALRQKYITDENGRRVRTLHAAKVNTGGKQLTLWANIDSAPRKHIEAAFAQRRRQIVGDCHQLANDVDYFNRSRSDERPIQLVLDFTDDVEELQLLEEDKSEAA